MSGEDEDAAPEVDRDPETDEDLRGLEEVTAIAPSSSAGAPRARPSSVAERMARRAKKDPRVHTVLSGRYRLEKPIAKGGMGRVYLATQLNLNRTVAVKVLNKEFKETDPAFVRRFCLEAEISARISHPNVVTVHDYGEAEGGELFMAMEYLRGRTLSALIQKEAPLPAGRLLHIAIQIARALREAHSIGIIHRDLKPGNVMLIDSGEDLDFVKVLDFGLVKLFVPEGQPIGVEGDVELTRAGTLLGSPRYMSPEQIRGETLDPRTDIYSFGIILFQMAAGRPPFTGSSSVDLIYKHIHEPVPSIRDVANGVDCPAELERIIGRALEKDRERRYSSMSELLAALKQAKAAVGEGGETPRRPLPKEEERANPDEPTNPPDAPDGSSGEVERQRSLRAAALAEPIPGAIEPLDPKTAPSRDAVAPGASQRPYVVAAILLCLLSLAIGAFATLKAPRPEPRPESSRPAAMAAPPPAASPSPTTPPEVRLELSTRPAGATVRLDGEAVCKTPCTLNRPLDSAPHLLVFALEGYEPGEAKLSLTENRILNLDLMERQPDPEPKEPDPAEPEAKSPQKRRTKHAEPAHPRPAHPAEAAPSPSESPAEESPAPSPKKRSPRYRNNPY